MITLALLTYNREEYICEALDAILKQSDHDFELIVIDNHSTDRTHELIYSRINDRPNTIFVRLDCRSNAGNSFNTALLYAKNPYVIVTHDDDILDVEYVKKCKEILKNNSDVGLIGANVELIDEAGDVISNRLYPVGKYPEDLLIPKRKYLDIYVKQKLWIPTPTHCINRKIYFDYFSNNVVSESIKPPIQNNSRSFYSQPKIVNYAPSGDIEMCFAINEVSKIYFISKPMLSYRQHNNQESRNVNQSNPLLDAFTSILARKENFSKKTLSLVGELLIKYRVQKFFFENDLVSLKAYLDDKKNANHPLIDVLGRWWHLRSVMNREVSGKVVSDEIFSSLFRGALDVEKCKDVYIVLVGSMLLSYVVYVGLLAEQLNVNLVIDRAPARVGCSFFDLFVRSYEDGVEILEKEAAGKKVLFVITSERLEVDSITAYLKRKYIKKEKIYSVEVLSWRDLYRVGSSSN